jgi:hypothetical protein
MVILYKNTMKRNKYSSIEYVKSRFKMKTASSRRCIVRIMGYARSERDMGNIERNRKYAETSMELRLGIF